MHSFFLAITGRTAGGDVADHHVVGEMLYELITIFYVVCFMLFAVLNMITGVFADEAIGHAQACEGSTNRDTMIERL